MNRLPKRQLTKAIKYWWLQLLNGLLLVGVGVVIVNIPDDSYYSLAMTISVICLIIGSSQLFYTLCNRKQLMGWGWYLSNGVVDVAIGLVLVLNLMVSTELLPFFVGLWLVFKSTNGISFAIDLKEYGVRYWWWMILISILVGLIAILVISYPAIHAVGPIMLTSWAYILCGAILIGGSLHIRKLHELPQRIVNKITNSL
jgi:Uncharacterized conserved protein